MSFSYLIQKYLYPSFVFYPNFKHCLCFSQLHWYFTFHTGHSNHLTPLQLESLLTEEPTSRFWLVISLHVFNRILISLSPKFSVNSYPLYYLIKACRVVACRYLQLLQMWHSSYGRIRSLRRISYGLMATSWIPCPTAQLNLETITLVHMIKNIVCLLWQPQYQNLTTLRSLESSHFFWLVRELVGVPFFKNYPEVSCP